MMGRVVHGVAGGWTGRHAQQMLVSCFMLSKSSATNRVCTLPEGDVDLLHRFSLVSVHCGADMVQELIKPNLRRSQYLWLAVSDQ